jgi:lysophospholipase L1-like esterase
VVKRLLVKRLLLSLCSTLLVLMVLEIVARLVCEDDLYPPPREDVASPLPGCRGQHVPFGFIPLARISSVYPDDPRGYFDEGNVINHDFNSAGWRDREHTLAKPPNTYRILGLGDSYLYGQGVRFEDICLTRLGGRMAAEGRPGISIEAINAGLSGMNTANERDLLLERGLRYDPDLVIVHFVLNDVEPKLMLFSERPQVEFWIQYLSTYQEPDWLSEYSTLWGWARQRYLLLTRSNAYIDSCLENYFEDGSKWEFCRDALSDITRICRERDIGLLVVIFPFLCDLDDDYPFRRIHDQVSTHCDSTGVQVLDLFETFRGRDAQDLWVHRVDPHPNETAHRLAAEAIFDFLEEQASHFPGLPLGK